MRLEIIDTAYGGNGVGKLEDGKTVFVPYTVTGDVIDVKLLQDKGSYWTGKISAILENSPYRTTPVCEYHGICGGCQFGHISYSYQLEVKKNILLNALRKIDNLPDIKTIRGEPFNYRCRATLKSENGKVGFFAQNSNNFIPVDRCPVLSETLFETVQKWASMHISPDLLSISVLENNNGEILATVTSKGRLPKVKDAEPFTGLKIGSKPVIVSADGSVSGKGLYGQHVIKYSSPFGNIPATYEQFFQSNKHLLDIFQKTATDVPEGHKTLELYAGSGFFTAALQKKTNSLIAIEMNETAAMLGIAEGYPIYDENVDFITRTHFNHTLLFADPPREGIDRKTLESIIEYAPEEIVYVSCNPATLGRDIGKLTEKYYTVNSVVFIDMFPHTYHVEAIVKLQRIK